MIKKTGTETADQLRERYKWQKIQAPKKWIAKAPGEELLGYYGGRTTRAGAFGQYDVILVHVPLKGAYMLSGTMILQLADAAMIPLGHPVRVVWEGEQDLGTVDGEGNPKRMKQYELFIADGDPIDASALPELRQ